MWTANCPRAFKGLATTPTAIQVQVVFVSLEKFKPEDGLSDSDNENECHSHCDVVAVDS